jgi:hypothetical protein
MLLRDQTPQVDGENFIRAFARSVVSQSVLAWTGMVALCHHKSPDT